MSKRQILMVIGLWIMILCGNGFPNYIRWILGIVTGLLIIFIAYKTKSDKAVSGSSGASNLPYVENRNE